MRLDLHEAATPCSTVWAFCCLFGVLGFLVFFFFYIHFHLATLQTVKQAVKTVLF